MSDETLVLVDMTDPAAVMDRLARIENDLATRQNVYEAAARGWYAVRRDVERAHAMALLGSLAGSVAEKKAEADLAGLAVEGVERQDEYEALKAVIRVLETRGTICMSILKAQGRT